MDDILAYIVAIVGIISAIAIIKVISDNLVRKRLVDKHADTETVKAMLDQTERGQRESALKWGIVAVSSGLSLLLIDLLNLQPEDPSTIGIIVLFGGIGFLIYFYVSRLLPTTPKK